MFETKYKAKEYAKELLNKVELHTPLEEEDHKKMCFILKGHDKHDEKVGVGIKEIFVGTARHFGSRCFFIKRIDDSIIDFSYLNCFSTKSIDSRFAEAYRNAIVFEKLDFQYNTLNRTCGKCSKETDDLHVHHLEPTTVKWQITYFKKFYNIVPSPEMFKPLNAFTENFVDKDIEAKAVHFHNTFSNLILLCVDCHKEEHRRVIK